MFKSNDKEYKLLGIFGAKITNEDVKGIIDSICRNAINDGWKVMLFTTFCDLYDVNEETAGEASIFMLADMKMLDAVIILPESILDDNTSRRIIERAQKENVPVISVDKQFGNVPCIRFDYITTFEQIVRHVIEHHGCRSINFVAGFKGNEFSEARLECCKKLLSEYGIPFDENRVGYGDFWETPTIAVMDNFMKTGLPLPEAIVCFNDSMAITVCQYLSKHNIKVPDDIIVTGFDGIELEKYYQPRLTTASVDFSSVGKCSIDMLNSIISGITVNTVVIPYKMRLGQSCGCIATTSKDPCDKILKLYERVSNSAWHEDFMFSYLRSAIKCSNLPELAAVMGKHGDYYEWFCVNTDIFESKAENQRYHEVYTQNMNAFLIRERDDIRTQGRIFPTNEMLPDFGDVLKKHDILYFSPLHFMEEVLGYTCASLSFADEFVYANRRRYVTNTSQVLENLIGHVRLERANSELAEMHIHDSLTGLYNRRGFYKQFERVAAEGKTAYIFSADMDRLKYINDNFGHNEGDIAIRQIASALTCTTDFELVCSRFGGDEFAVIGYGDNFQPDKYVSMVREYLKKYNENSGKPYSVEVSFGWEMAHLTKSTEIDELIKTADARMYEDKRSRKAARE